MHWEEILRRAALLLRRDRATRELEHEMLFHRELRARALQASGISASDAAVAARRRFGNSLTIQEASRDMWGLGSLDDLGQDIRYAARRLRQQPGFTAAITLILALGIGAAAAMFSAVDAAMLRPLPFARPEQLVTIRNAQIPFDPGPGQSAFPKSHALEFQDLRAMPEFNAVAAYASGGLNLSDPVRPLHVKVGVVTVSFFHTLGILPQVGRDFDAAEGRPGGDDVAVLSDALWRNQFGSRPMVDQVIRLNDKPFTVVGVEPPGFSFPDQSDLWIPLTVPFTLATFEPFRGVLSETVIARTASGISPARASAGLLTAWHRGLVAESDSFLHTNLRSMIADVAQHGAATPLQQDLVGVQREALLILLGATLCLLLIACANVANLLLAQTVIRRREVALRAVLGARRGRIVRQLLAESVLLSLAGAGAGLLLAPLLLHLMAAIVPSHLTAVVSPRLDGRVLVFAVTLSLVTGVLFGLWPAWSAARTAPAEAIKAGASSGNTASAGSGVRQVLVITEVALTLILLIGAGLMLRSFQHLMHQDRGIETDHVGSVELTFTKREDRGASRVQVMERLIARIGSVPGVQSAGFVNDLPLSGSGAVGLEVKVPGATLLADDDDNRFAINLSASSGWFTALGVRFIRGRDFLPSEESAGSHAAIINQTLAEAYWPHADPIGRTFSYMGTDHTVVGVIANIRVTTLTDGGGRQVFLPLEVGLPRSVALVARSTLPPAAVLRALSAAVRAVDPSQAVFHLRMLDDVVNASVAPRRSDTLLIGLFAGLALLLASFGVYAVVNHSMTQRNREFGIRAALGARSADLLLMVSREMARLVAAGVLLGLVGAWMLAHLIGSQLYGVTTHDVETFFTVPLVIWIPVAVATLLPARRALRVSPAEVMRES